MLDRSSRVRKTCRFRSTDNSDGFYFTSYITLNIFQNGKGVLSESRKSEDKT